jgi:hypothetical protein
MLFFSRNKKKQISEKTQTLKDVRETKHVLALFPKPIDETNHSFCFISFSCIVKSTDGLDKVIKIKDAFEKRKGSDINNSYVDNINHKYYKYLGETKPKNLPNNFDSLPLDWDKLIEAIRRISITPKGVHFGLIFFLIKNGLFGTGYKDMKQSDYRKKMKESGFEKSIGRDNLSINVPNTFDYLCYMIPINNFDEKHEILSAEDQKEVNKQDDIRLYCCELIDQYWLLMTQ